MPASRKPEVQGRTAQLSIKIDADLYEKYKVKVKDNGSSITDNIESHMRDYVGEIIIQSNVVDITKVLKDVEELKQAVGELNPGWQERMSSLSVS